MSQLSADCEDEETSEEVREYLENALQDYEEEGHFGNLCVVFANYAEKWLLMHGYGYPPVAA